MGAMSIYNSLPPGFYKEPNPTKGLIIRTETVSSEGNKTKINLIISGSGKHELDFLSFNARPGKTSETVEFNGNESITIPMEIVIPDPDSPYVIVVRIDHDPSQWKEKTGSMVNPEFREL